MQWFNTGRKAVQVTDSKEVTQKGTALDARQANKDLEGTFAHEVYKEISDAKKSALPGTARYNEINFTGWGNKSAVWFNFRDGLTNAASANEIDTYVFGKGLGVNDITNHADISAKSARLDIGITTPVTTKTHLNGAKGNNVIINSTAADGYTVLAKMNTTNGVFCLGHYQGAIHHKCELKQKMPEKNALNKN